MVNANSDIKKLLKIKKVSYWEIAAKLNISETTFGRRMRVELDTEHKNKVKTTVNEILAERGD